MRKLELLKKEMDHIPNNPINLRNYLLYLGYRDHFDASSPFARAYAIESLLVNHRKHIYWNDLIAGSIRGLVMEEEGISEPMLARANKITDSYGSNHFWTNMDHFAPDYETFLADGIPGTLSKIQKSLLEHQEDPDYPKKKAFLESAAISMRAFGRMVGQYGMAAACMAKEAESPAQAKQLTEIARICEKLQTQSPGTFHEALQLVWLAHVSFLYEGRYAMAFGRMDQYLYPFYKADVENGTLTRDQALELMQCTLYKIGESRIWGADDVVNIAIGGIKPDGTGGINPLSYLILEAVKNCNIPGPNLSARLYRDAPDQFLDECLKVIGTGLGYPALMNDEVNIPALHRHGYSLEDCRNYCMVGCIENFIQGKQPPWSDGRYNVPKFIELTLNRGKCMQTGVPLGPDTGAITRFATMDDFMEALQQQMTYGAAEYMMHFRNENERYNRAAYMQPYLSCYCRCCIERGLDINDGGALYPSVHGAGCMGIATVSDSLAAIEKVVYEQKVCSIETLRDALIADYEGYDELRAALRKAPKYGNNDNFVDRYAVWYVSFLDSLFGRYRTRDGGAIYTAIASNVSNIPAGAEVAATPDGRRNGEPLSDAASPMHGQDRNGPTAVILSLSKPDYTLVSCGTVLNQKYAPSMFTEPGKRARLLSLIKVYFQKGGQEIQINAVSREVLAKAMENPDDYRSLVVRVSGFSAYFTGLDKCVQEDILLRTEH